MAKLNFKEIMGSLFGMDKDKAKDFYQKEKQKTYPEVSGVQGMGRDLVTSGIDKILEIVKEKKTNNLKREAADAYNPAKNKLKMEAADAYNPELGEARISPALPPVKVNNIPSKSEQVSSEPQKALKDQVNIRKETEGTKEVPVFETETFKDGKPENKLFSDIGMAAGGTLDFLSSPSGMKIIGGIISKSDPLAGSEIIKKAEEQEMIQSKTKATKEKRTYEEEIILCRSS